MKNFSNSLADYSKFDEDQMEEIRIGLEEGLDVSIYADPDFMPLKMEAIRIGLEKGLDVSQYARHEYDWFQMEEIRLGLEFGLPISRYANPSIPYKTMHEIRLGLAEGIDLGRRTDLNWKTLEQIRLAHTFDIDLDPYIEKGYDSYQLEEIRKARESGIIMDTYLNPSFRAASIHEIRLGMQDFIDVTIFAKPEYSWQQMREIRLGLLEQLDVSKFSNHLYNWRQMREIRLGLADGINVDSYNRLLYTEYDMHDMRVALLETMNIAGSNAQQTISTTNFNLEISEDGMQATFTLLSPLHGRTKTKIRHILKEHGIVSGISTAMLDAIISEHTLRKPYTIATGKPNKTGRDGFYHFTFDPKSIGSKTAKDGSLDLMNGKLYHIVKKGEKLAIYCPAEEGLSGYNIYGEEIPAKRGKEQKRLHGKGVLLLPDGKTYQALTDGCVQYDEEKNELNVVKMAVLPTVNLATGNVNFRGNVYVTGDVGDGVTINATDDIIVDGNVEAATLNAGKNIYLKKGIHGKHRGVLNAHKNIASGYCEAVTIHCKGDFQTNYCMEVIAEVEGLTEIMGTKGTIIGGYLESQCGLSCTSIGNAAGTETKIRIGPTNKMTEKTRRLLMADDRVRKELLLLQRGMEKFQIRYAPEVYHNMELYQKLENAVYTKNLEMQKLNEAEMKLDREMYAVRNAKVSILGTIFEGASIQIEDLFWKASLSNNICVSKINGRINISSNET